MEKKNITSNGYLQKIDDYLERSPFKGFLSEVDSFFLKNNIFQSFPVYLHETSNEVIIEAELPGIEKENIKIDIQESFIKIMITNEHTSKNIGNSHFHKNNKERIIKMPELILKNNTKAFYKNGILEIHAKKQPYEQKIIEIE